MDLCYALQGLKPMCQPLWIFTALELESEDAHRLVGAQILYKLREDADGWYLGYVVGQLADVSDLTHITGGGDLLFPRNYSVRFEAADEEGDWSSTLLLCLSTSNYATSAACDPPGTWCLVCKPEGKAEAAGALLNLTVGDSADTLAVREQQADLLRKASANACAHAAPALVTGSARARSYFSSWEVQITCQF